MVVPKRRKDPTYDPLPAPPDAIAAIVCRPGALWNEEKITAVWVWLNGEPRRSHLVDLAAINLRTFLGDYQQDDDAEEAWLRYQTPYPDHRPPHEERPATLRKHLAAFDPALLPFDKYLPMVFSRRCWDYAKSWRRQRERQIGFDSPDAAGSESKATWTDDLTLYDELRDAINRCARDLSPTERRVLKLMAAEMTIEEIMSTMGVSRQYVHTNMCRLRKKLAQRLKARGYDL